MPVPTDSSYSVCLVRLSALGDVVMTLPLVRAIQAHWPRVRLTWVIASGAYPLVSALAAEGIEFIVLDKPNGLGDYADFHHRMSGRRFDVLLCLQAAWRANLLYPMVKAGRKVGFSCDRAKDLHRLFVRETIEPRRTHNVDAFFQFAEKLGVPVPVVPEWRLPVDPSAQAWAMEALPEIPFIAISPCASKAERNWAAQNYAAVARELQRRHGLAVVLLGGPAPEERAMAEKIAAKLDGPACNLVGTTLLPQMVATLARARLLLAPDTGAVHIANALGRPVVGLYTSAQSARTGPYKNLQFCVDRYEEAVRKFLHKDPGQELWELRVHDSRAMDLITVTDVLSACEAALRAEP